MQSISCEMPGWMKHKLESRLLGEVSITSNMQMTNGRKQRRSSWWKWKRKVKKLAWNSAFRKLRSWMASGPITSWQIDRETMETVRDFIFLGSKITVDGRSSHEIKRLLLLGRKAMINLDSILKSRDITLPTKVHLVKAMVFPVVMYGCESCTIKKAGRTETPILWPPDSKNWLIGKDPDAGKDWKQEKGTTEDEMVGWHHRLNGHEFEQALGVGDGQASLGCRSSGVTKSQTWLSDWTELIFPYPTGKAEFHW